MSIFFCTAHILIFQYLLFSKSFLKWFWSTVSIIYTLLVWWHSLVYLIMGQRTFFIVFSIVSFSIWDIGSRKDSSSIQLHTICAKIFIPMSHLICLCEDYLQATSVSEYFKMFSPKLANLKLQNKNDMCRCKAMSQLGSVTPSLSGFKRIYHFTNRILRVLCDSQHGFRETFPQFTIFFH